MIDGVSAPLPWRVHDGIEPWLVDALGHVVDAPQDLEHAVRLVNAEPEIVAALEVADRYLDGEPLHVEAGCVGGEACRSRDYATDLVRAALAKVQP